MELPTVKVAHGEGFAVINQTDFDPSIHSLFSGIQIAGDSAIQVDRYSDFQVSELPSELEPTLATVDESPTPSAVDGNKAPESAEIPDPSPLPSKKPARRKPSTR